MDEKLKVLYSLGLVFHKLFVMHYCLTYSLLLTGLSYHPLEIKQIIDKTFPKLALHQTIPGGPSWSKLLSTWCSLTLKLLKRSGKLNAYRLFSQSFMFCSCSQVCNDQLPQLFFFFGLVIQFLKSRKQSLFYTTLSLAFLLAIRILRALILKTQANNCVHMKHWTWKEVTRLSYLEP